MIDKNFYNGKTILVAGASGFIGSHLTKKLSALGANVIGSYLNRKPNQKLPNVKFVKADLTNYPRLSYGYKKYRLCFYVSC